MPRGRKSKLRARERRCQARVAQATSAEVEENPSIPCMSEGVPSRASAAGLAQKPRKAPSASFSEADTVGPKSNEGAKSKGKESSLHSLKAVCAPSKQVGDPFAKKVGMLMNYMLEKYKMNEPIWKEDMLKIINKRYRAHFPKILKRVSKRMEMMFGLNLKQIKSGSRFYSLVSQLDLNNDGSHSSSEGYHTNALLLPVLGVIFMNGNSISEKEIWEFVNILGIYEGTNHLIFGDVKKLLTKDLVEEQYLEYRQVPNSDPPSYEFLWGPRARADVNKREVIKFLAKVNGACLCTFSEQYEKAMQEMDERDAATTTMVVPSK